MNGHGGENFFKIQDTEVVHSEDLSKVLNEMHIKGLYNDILFILDTCEAMSLFDQVDAPNIAMVGSSVVGEHSLSDEIDKTLNTFVNDKFSHHLYEFLVSKAFMRKTTLEDFKRLFNYDKISSTLDIKSTHPVKKLDQIFLYEYFPLDKEDVTGGKGIDRQQEEVKFYDYADLD